MSDHDGGEGMTGDEQDGRPVFVWIVDRTDEIETLYVFEEEGQAYEFAARYSEAVVSQEVVMDAVTGAQFLVATADSEDEELADESRHSTGAPSGAGEERLMRDHDRAEQMTDDELDRELVLSIRGQLVHLFDRVPDDDGDEVTIVLERMLDEWDEFERVFGTAGEER